MATNFLDLPDELILQIVEPMFRGYRRHLRLLNRRIDHLISPSLFETLCFSDASVSTLKEYTSLSEYIDLGKELVFSRCTKKLDISISGAYSPDQHLPWLQLLGRLVPTLVNLQTLKWSHWPANVYPVSPLTLDVFNSFGSIPSLRELILRVIRFTPFPYFSLKSFSNLSSVTINWKHGADVSPGFISKIADLLARCPTLEQFTFSISPRYYPFQVPAFAPFFAGLPPTTCLKLRLLDLTGLCVSANDFRVNLRHFSSLNILRLMSNRHRYTPEQNDQICRLLLDESIYLNELTIDTTHPAGVLKYLSSYSGLEHLTFRSQYPGADTPEGIHHFFTSVLPRHSATLRELHLGWCVETPWTKDTTPEHLAQIEKCQQLTHLSCPVTLTIESTERTDRLLGGWMEAAMKLPCLQCLRFRQTCRGEPVLYQRYLYYDQATEHDLNLSVQLVAFGNQRIGKLKAGRGVPFKIIVMSPTLGP